MATTPNPPSKQPEPKVDAEALKAELLAEIKASLPSREELLEQARAELLDAGWQAPPKPKKAAPAYVPPEKGTMRIKIRSMNGKPAAPKVSIYDDSVLGKAGGRVHGYLHAGQVVDVPPEVLKDKSVQSGIQRLIEADRIEECSRLPATRPFFYASFAEAKANDPRLNMSLDEAEASVERIKMSADKRRQITAKLAASAED